MDQADGDDVGLEREGGAGDEARGGGHPSAGLHIRVEEESVAVGIAAAAAAAGSTARGHTATPYPKAVVHVEEGVAGGADRPVRVEGRIVGGARAGARL